jgi:hypothetical protein
MRSALNEQSSLETLMTETVLNRSSVALAVSPVQYDRRRVRAAECKSRRLSFTAREMDPRSPIREVSERRVKRFAIGAVFLSAALSMATSAALSQGTQGTPEQQEACTPDAMQLCGTFIPDAKRVEECLIQRIAVLSLRCREVIEKGRRSDTRSPSGSPHSSN